MTQGDAKAVRRSVMLSHDAGVSLDLDRLIHLLVTASTGAGKSSALRRLLEATHGLVPQLVIDPEGEFYTLRESGDYVLVGKDGDLPADPRSASLFARRLLELGCSAIVDLSEFQPHERLVYARDLFVALLDAPRDAWRDLLIVVDEAHLFAPEEVRKGQSALAKDALVDLVGRGRKRGYKVVLATLRLAKLDKDVAGECQDKLVGRSNLFDDRVRAVKELGVKADMKTWEPRLMHLEPGHFISLGPALSLLAPSEIHLDLPKTKPPPRGPRSWAAPAPRGAVLKVLEQLRDLPQEAEEEARDLATLRKHVADLKRELLQARKAQPRPPSVQKTDVRRVEVPVFTAAHVKRIEAQVDRAEKAAATFKQATGDLFIALATAQRLRDEAGTLTKALVPLPRAEGTIARSVEPRTGPRSNGSGTGLTGPEQRILDALAWLEVLGPTDHEETAVAFLAGYTVGGGAFNNPRGALRTKGLIAYRSGRLALTDQGRALARSPGVALTTEELHRRVLERLPGPEGRLLRVLLAAYPGHVSNEDLASQAGYEPGGGAFNNPRGRLRSLGLAEYPGKGLVRASPVLFLGAP